MPSGQTAIFGTLHRTLLKPLGFKKISTRSERAVGPLHQAVACFSSRFNSPNDLTFTLEFRVGHEAFFHMYHPGKSFPGLGEKSFMPLLFWRPKEEGAEVEKWWHLGPGSKLAEVEASVLATFERQGLSALQGTSTIEGILAFCEQRPVRANFMAWSWALHSLGREQEAQAVVDEAVRAAPHLNARKYVVAWATKLGYLRDVDSI